MTPALPRRKPDKKTIKRPKFRVPGPDRTKITRLPSEKLQSLQRDILAGGKTQKRMADEYGVPTNAIAGYKRDVMAPAVRHALRQRADGKISEVKEAIDWLLDEVKDSINQLKGRAKNKDGELILGDPDVHGSVAQLLGKANDIVRTLGEFTGELGDQAAPGGQQPTVIKFISIPKIGQTGVQVEIGRAKKEAVQLISAPEGG